MSYDRRCLALAAHFLDDCTAMRSAPIAERIECEQELAQEIQDVCESYIEQLEEAK